ncbi:protein translocase subunit SecD [Vibrio breoganii]|uniref:protein translocase subunit SecD n=1 Tax=Vibrio breoganii TaxID=553239 RepID=UPI000C8401F6|nr:protein translocase subunit SecD [Vibrio breoganii]
MKSSSTHRVKRINYSSKWKVIVLISSMILMLLSALPSVFGERHAIHLDNAIHSKNTDVVYRYLERNDIPASRITHSGDTLAISFETQQDQEQAQVLLRSFLGSEEGVTLALEPAAPNWLGTMGFKPITLGLDLRGGVQFLLDVDLAPVYEQHAQSLLDELRREFQVRGRVDNGSVIVNLGSASIDSELRSYLRSHYPHWTNNQSNSQLRLALSQEEQREIRNLTVQQNLQILRGRIEELGITEASVQRQGTHRIRIELPGVQDPTAAKNIIGATASLAFHEASPSATTRTKTINDQTGQPVTLSHRAILGGEHIIDARAQLGEMGTPEVNITLDSTGGRMMSVYSRSNIGKPMATVYSEYEQLTNGSTSKASEVISVATIQSPLGNRFRITGVGSLADAQELALLLRAGSLTAPITIVEERSIGPTLGAENVKNGFAALALGLSFTLVFIAFWYRKLGWVANAALVMNLVCLFGLLALIPGAVLTLPGIAGLVLTVGMAVDTNVLIFERIKEKTKQGHPFPSAIHNGFKSAFSSIFDANLTTMIVAVALYAIGNGPIQGFAMTLGLGLVTSMFTGVFASRILINTLWGRTASKVTQ